MSTSPKLPPSARDFLVYHRIVVDGVSTRSAADEAKISQTRVRQIVLRLTEWLVEALPTDTELSEAARLRLARHIAADRLERFYLQANRAWEQTTQPKFASVCLRVLAAQSKLAAIPGTLEAHAMDAILGPLPDDTTSLYATTGQSLPPSPPDDPRPTATASENPNSRVQGQQHPPTLDLGHSSLDGNPSLRDCSPAPSNGSMAAEKPPCPPAVTLHILKACDKPGLENCTARAEFFSPAHPSASNENDAPVTELRITPEQLGFTTSKALSRKDRRRLRRVLIAK